MSIASAKSLESARKIVRDRGGVCLVPLPGRDGISSHEKTFCDCEVEEMIAEALDVEKARTAKLLFALAAIILQPRDTPWPISIDIATAALTEHLNAEELK